MKKIFYALIILLLFYTFFGIPFVKASLFKEYFGMCYPGDTSGARAINILTKEEKSFIWCNRIPLGWRYEPKFNVKSAD